MEEKKEGKEESSKAERGEEGRKQQQQQVDDVAELKDRLLRLAAEFDNYKKRVAKDIDNAKIVGRAEFVRDLLPVVDEFEIALAAMDKDGNQQMARGIELLYSNFMDALKKAGLREVPTNGMFDPYMHEIMQVKVDEKRKPGMIIDVTKKGYLLGDIMLRPASVIITKGPLEQEDAGRGNQNSV